MGVTVGVLRLPHADGLELPKYETEGAAGLDLIAAIGKNDKITLETGKWSLVPTGLKLQLPEGYEAQVRPRSGLALRHGVTVLNAPGTIDADYRGEVSVLLVNWGPVPFEIVRGMRIAQMVVAPVTRVTLEERGALAESRRGAGGYGSTGV
ncbi:dUTP diphosphatase [Alsobacter sp. SYSU M60028]|uniref:Deoxyuridine 5'-triphosphate nucleotidohydrolase n=1 Tax=Alsobacter ponti TaxID=2962936 RepID=A0ABT1LBZ1_9HYPH|nr:dUTP diphosphatase [Alsobacter ponti]MCP8938591.1 dUTP diphosphatase [Alsobacter ponti]